MRAAIKKLLSHRIKANPSIEIGVKGGGRDIRFKPVHKKSNYKGGKYFVEIRNNDHSGS